MLIKKASLIGLLLLIGFTATSFGQSYVTVKAQKGDGIYSLLRRYNLPTTGEMVEKFKEINAKTLKQGTLTLDTNYNLPIETFTYNGKSVRTTIESDDYNRALRIIAYNHKLTEDGIKEGNFIETKDLWVPLHELKPEDFSSIPTSAPSSTPANNTSRVNTPSASLGTTREALFGSANATVSIKSKALEGCVYYVIAGHGGPDSGAQSKYQNITLNEDEYAYDVALRLAKELMQLSATVYIIVQDPNDGMREGTILRGDRDEVFYGNVRMKGTLKERLFQRSGIVNELYDKHAATAKLQRAIMIHVDSREYSPNPEQIDVHFLHNPESEGGRTMSRILWQVFKEKYALYQPSRGYHGKITPREDLHMLNQTKPFAVLVELGNIQHPLDRERIMGVGNRGAIARWLAEGLLNDAKQSE